MEKREEQVNKFQSELQARQIELDTAKEVYMANDMVKGKSKLKLNEMKLLRALIMQINKTDRGLYVYDIPVMDLANMLGISPKFIYREMDKMTTNLMSEVIYIGDGNPKHKWQKFHWVDTCKYQSGVLTIKLSEELAPYVLGLQNYYTRYPLEQIVQLKSIYSLRLYELLLCAMRTTPHASETELVYISVEVIRKATNTENKYSQIGQFKDRVIMPAISEINEKTSQYHIEARDYKESGKVVGFYFDIESQAGYAHRIRNGKKVHIDIAPDEMENIMEYEKQAEAQQDATLDGQMTIDDLF